MATLVLVVLISRTLGAHFHLNEPHHQHDHDHLLSSIAAVQSTSASHIGMEADHLLDHEAGAVDVEDIAAPAGAQAQLLLVVASCLGIALSLASAVERFPVLQPPFRPPRLRLRFHLTPPSHGPPLAA